MRFSFASFLWSPVCSKKEKKPRKFSVCVAFGLTQDAVSTLSLFCLFACWGACKHPIDFIIGQSAVNTSTHDQSTILQDFLPCFLLVFRNHIKHSFKDVLRPNPVNFVLHNLKIQLLIICIPLSLRWIICGV